MIFSIIIPLYNKEKSIFSTIKSVLDQSFPDFEIIVVDDGSTDNSLKVVKSIKDSRLKIFEKENGGVSSARNYGIRKASNPWIAFLDGDDLWRTEHLEEYSKAIISNSEINWLFSGYISVSKLNKEYQFVYHKSGQLHNIFDDLLNGIKIHTSTVCVRSVLFNNYEDLYFSLNINNSEDREVWYKLCCIDSSPYYINKSLSVYKIDDENSLTKNSKSLGNNNFLTVRDRIEKFILYHKVTSSNKIKFIKYLDNFNKKAIFGYYIRNKKLRPEYKFYVGTIIWILLTKTISMPIFIKRIVVRVVLFIS